MPVAARPIAVHILTRLVVGGPSRAVLATLHRMSAAGVRTVLVTGIPGAHEREATELLREFPDLPVLRMPHLVRPPHPVADARALIALTTAIRRLRPTVIHTHTAKAGGVGRVAACLAGGCGLGRAGRPPLRVHTFHGHSMDRASAGALAGTWRAIERGLARRATDVVVALSPELRRQLVERLGRRVAERVVVVPLPYEPPARRYGLGGGTPGLPEAADGERRLAFVGRGVRVKGLDHLAAVHARLSGTDGDAARRLRIVIAGPVEPRVRRRVDRIVGPAGLAERWTYLGAIPGPTDLLERVDGVVLPSRSEGTPLSVIEALAAGLPVLASAVGGVPELLERDWSAESAGEWGTRPAAPRGLAVPAGDVDAWAAAVARFVADPRSVPGERRERRAFVARVFDAEARTAELSALYGMPGSHAAWRSAAAREPAAGDRPSPPRRATAAQQRPRV